MVLPPLFAADVMLGKTAKWLRMFGFDTFYDNRAGDPFLRDLCLKENRVLLTRDTRLRQSMPAGSGYLVVQNLPRRQLVEISGVFGLDLYPLPPRCSVCNGELTAVDKGRIGEKVPAYVFTTQSAFSQCLLCGRIYWPGTHLDRIRLFLADIAKSGEAV